jgi:hypothetical protein
MTAILAILAAIGVFILAAILAIKSGLAAYQMIDGDTHAFTDRYDGARITCNTP